MINDLVIEKKIKNDSSKNEFFSDSLIYELNQSDLSLYNKCFISKRHKNEIPKVINFKECKGKKLISDSLTILSGNENSLLLGYLGSFKYLVRTELKIDLKGNLKSLKVFLEVNEYLKPDEELDNIKFKIKNIKDITSEIDEYAKEVVAPFKVKEKIPPTVYSTWSYYGDKVSRGDLIENLEAIKERSVLVDVFQIDDGWEKSYGKWETNEKFESLDDISETIKSYGLTSGIWTAPFVVSKESDIYKNHKNWLLRNKLGILEIFRVNDRNYYILDITVEEVYKYLEELYKELTLKGFKYHKVDFTRAPLVKRHANYRNKFISPVEAYIKAIESIRKGIGDSFLNICGGLFEGVIGIADSVRTSSDVFSMWELNSKKNFEKLFRQNIYRYYMNNYFFNDPDTLSIRRNLNGDKLSLGLLSDEETKIVVLNQILSCGMKTISERMKTIDEDRLDYFKYIKDLNIERIEVIDFMSESTPSKFKLYSKDKEYIAYINWSDEEKEIDKVKLNAHSSIILNK